MTSFIVAPPNANEKTLVAAYDNVVADLAEHGPSAADLERIRAKMRSDWYDQLEVPITRASTLSHAVLFDGNAEIVSHVPVEIASVTAQDVQSFAKKYLVKTNRTLIWRVPEPKQTEVSGKTAEK
jgi:predicted Zn-dependent peptidase